MFDAGTHRAGTRTSVTCIYEKIMKNNRKISMRDNKLHALHALREDGEGGGKKEVC